MADKEKEEIDNTVNINEITGTNLLKMAHSKMKLESYDDAQNENNYINRIILITEINPEAAEAVSEMIRFYNQIDTEQNLPADQRKPIKVYIDTDGGNIFSAFSIIDAINLSKTPVWTINMGTAFSAGFEIFISGHRRIAYPTSSFLFHEGSTGANLDAGKFRNYAHFYERILEKSKTFILKRTKITEDMYEQKKNDDWWMFADEAYEFGICDEITKEFV